LATFAHATMHRAHVSASPPFVAASSRARKRAHAFSVKETCASSGNLTSSVPSKNPSASYAYSRSSFPLLAMAPPVPRPTAAAPLVRLASEFWNGGSTALATTSSIAASVSGRKAAICCRSGFTKRARR